MKEQMKVLKWVWSANKWHIGTSNCTVPLIRQKDACNCIGKLAYFSGIGSSHIRSDIDWLLESCDFSFDRLPRKHGSFQWRNLVYIRSHFVTDMIERLKELRTPDSQFLRTRSVISMQRSNWDLLHKGQLQFMNRLPELVKQIKGLTTDPNFNNSIFIFLNGQAYPDKATWRECANKTPTKYWERGHSNNFIAQVFNYQMRKHIKDMNIDIVDMFSLLYPRHNEAVCRQHYMCRYDGPLIGLLGRTLMQYIMGDICSKI